MYDRGIDVNPDLPYFLPSEVVLHNKADDLWVSFHGKVYDLSPLVKNFEKDPKIKVVLAYAGKDISHWFDKKTKNLKQRVDPKTGAKVANTPHGLLPDSSVPSTKWQPKNSQPQAPWWLDDQYHIGYLTKKARPIKIINSLAPCTHRTNLIWVPEEETLDKILLRIGQHNSHAKSYTLKFEGRILHAMKTLKENQVPDERDKFMQLGITDDSYIPAVTMYFNDDLTRD